MRKYCHRVTMIAPLLWCPIDETGESFGVAAVLSTDTIFTRLPSETGTILVYQAGGATYRKVLAGLNIVWFILVTCVHSLVSASLTRRHK